jgi:hypothetical protein
VPCNSARRAHTSVGLHLVRLVPCVGVFRLADNVHAQVGLVPQDGFPCPTCISPQQLWPLCAPGRLLPQLASFLLQLSALPGAPEVVHLRQVLAADNHVTWGGAGTWGQREKEGQRERETHIVLDVKAAHARVGLARNTPQEQQKQEKGSHGA